MQVPRCFHPRSSLSRILGSRGLVDGPLPTPWRKPRYRKYPPPCVPRYRRRLWILAAPLSSRPLASSLWCPAPARICEKHHGSSIILVVRVCRLGYPPGAKLEKAQRTSPPASDCIWFWYICCSTKHFRRERNF